MFNDVTTLGMVTQLLELSKKVPAMLPDGTIVDGRSGRYLLTKHSTYYQMDLYEASVECVRRVEQHILMAIRSEQKR